MDWLKDLKPLADLGLTGLMLCGVLYIAIRPPRWLVTFAESHHQLAEGAAAMAVGLDAMGQTLKEIPKREEFQELLIGQEALRRETVEVKEELRELRRALDGRRG